MTMILMLFINVLLSREKWAHAELLSSENSSSPSKSSIGYSLISISKSPGYCATSTGEPQSWSSSSFSSESIQSPSYTIPSNPFCKPDRCGSSSSSFVSPSYNSPCSSSSGRVETPSYSISSSSSYSSSSSSSSSSSGNCGNCGVIRKPRSCLEFKQRGYNTSGVYTIAPCDHRPCDMVEVYCDMDTDGGGWTVFQNRGKNTSMDFKRNYNAYRCGFGDIQTDFWLGNEYIHCLTSQTYTELMVIMQDWCNKKLIEYYRCFYVSTRNTRFELHLKNATVTSSTDSLMPHSNTKFSTYDRDTGNRRARQLGRSGWWHTAPHSNLNGEYRTKEDSKHCCRERNSHMLNETMHSCKTDGIFWRKWHGITYSLKATTMMLRGRDPQDRRAVIECKEFDCLEETNETTCPI